MANGTSFQYVLAEEELSCPICFEEYEQFDCQRHPKLLLCLHTFCFDCIQTLRQPHGRIQCSICRTDHDVKDLSELLDNYIVFDYLERKQVLMDEELANKLNEENCINDGVSEEEIVDCSTDNNKPIHQAISEQELSLTLSDEHCSEEDLSINVFSEEEVQSIAEYGGAVQTVSDGNSVEEVNSVNDEPDQTFSVCEDESDASYNSPAESLSGTDNDLAEDNVHAEDHTPMDDTNALIIESPLLENDAECKYSSEDQSENDTYVADSEDHSKDNDLNHSLHLDDSWETEEEVEELDYPSNEC